MREFTRVRFGLTIILYLLVNVPGDVLATDIEDHSAGQGIAFSHVDVVPMDREQILADQTVLVAAGRIQEIGPSAQVEIPDGFKRIDGTGRYLLPAYSDMHTHVLGEAWNMFLPPEEKALSRPESRYFQHPMQQGVWSFITQNLYGPIPAEQRQFIRDGFVQFQIQLISNLNQRGVKLLAGTDTPLPSLVPGFALHRELEELVNAGLSPYEALRCSTTNPFEYLGELDNAGTIQTGKLANLVLLGENPLQDISNSRKIEGVVVQGRWLSGGQIRERLELIAASSR